jgi:hypothetical protein
MFIHATVHEARHRLLTESKLRSGREPFKQFPVIFNSSIVWTAGKPCIHTYIWTHTLITLPIVHIYGIFRKKLKHAKWRPWLSLQLEQERCTCQSDDSTLCYALPKTVHGMWHIPEIPSAQWAKHGQDFRKPPSLAYKLLCCLPVYNVCTHTIPGVPMQPHAQCTVCIHNEWA